MLRRMKDVRAPSVMPVPLMVRKAPDITTTISHILLGHLNGAEVLLFTSETIY